MATESTHSFRHQQDPVHATHSRQAGFATVTCLTLAPFLAVVFMAILFGAHVIKNRSRVQAICVQRTSLLAEDLGKLLRNLMRLNRRARTLRHSHQHAERALEIAKAAGFTPGIVGAQIWLRETEALQILLAIQQRAILTDAYIKRVEHRRELRQALHDFEVKNLRFGPNSMRALAVRASPPRDIAPEYLPVVDFARRQAQSVRFSARLAPKFPGFEEVRQRTDCVITLEKRERSWQPKIVEASARSSWHSWPVR